MKIKDKFDKVEVNTMAAREHVGGMERGIRLVKERSQCVISDLCSIGFTHLHKMIMIFVHCVYFIVMMLNAAPADSGILEKFPQVKFSQVAMLT